MARGPDHLKMVKFDNGWMFGCIKVLLCSLLGLGLDNFLHQATVPSIFKNEQLIHRIDPMQHRVLVMPVVDTERVFTHIKCKKEQPVDYDEDLYSSDLLWDDIPRSDIVLGGDSIWPLAASRYGEEDISTQNLLHLHDPLLTSTMVTAGDEAEQVNDLLFDELERITISNHSPSPQLDLGIADEDREELIHNWESGVNNHHYHHQQDAGSPSYPASYYSDPNHYYASDHAYTGHRLPAGQSVGNALVSSMATLANSTDPIPEYGGGDVAYSVSSNGGVGGGYIYLSNNHTNHCASSGNYEGSEQDVPCHQTEYSYSDFLSEEEFVDCNPGQRETIVGATAGHGHETSSDSAVSSMTSERVSSRESFCFSDEESQASRDERRARALNIPIPTEAIINLPIDEFNELLTRHTLTETQLALIRDIRRRGKNKVAAQNCRKRKMDQIMGLQGEVHGMLSQKESLEAQQHQLMAIRQRAKERYSKLYQYVVDSSTRTST